MVPLLYWWISNFSKYLITKPVMIRLQSRDVIETSLHRILALQPDFFYHGANRIFGGIYARLPGLDLSYSVNNFDKAKQLEIFPIYFVNHGDKLDQRNV